MTDRTENMSSEDHDDYELNNKQGAYYELPEDEGEDPGKPDNGGNRLKYLKMLFNMLTVPRRGWREIRRSHMTGEEACRGIFYPMTGLASLSNFANLFFDPERTITQEVINALLTFTSFFFSYFLVFFFGKILLRGKGPEILTSDFGKAFTAYSLSSLALFYTLYALLPMLEPILVLLPLWTIFAITRGIKVLRIPEPDRTSATVWLSLLIVGLPLAVGYLFDMML